MGPLVGGARAGLREARSGSIGWRLGGGDPEGARAFVAVMEETGAVFRKVREGVLAGRAGGGGRGFCGWGTRTDRRGRCDPGSLPDSRAGLEPAPPLPSRVSRFPESGNDPHPERPSSSVVPWPGSRRLNRRPGLWPDGEGLQKSRRGRCWHKCRETQRGAWAAEPCPSPRCYGIGRTLLPRV